jgi:hypothetical protein
MWRRLLARNLLFVLSCRMLVLHITTKYTTMTFQIAQNIQFFVFFHVSSTSSCYPIHILQVVAGDIKTDLRGFLPRANYTDRAIAAC